MREFVSQLREKWLFLAVWSAFVWACQWITVGVPFADNMIYFACWSVALPLVGNFLKLPPSSLLASALWVLIHIPTSFPISMGVPTLFATFSWRVSKNPKSCGHFLIHCFLPLFCMFLFYISPVGDAWAYSLFWCVPIALYFLSLVRSSTLMERALQSTFIAHALGSIVWVYFVPMSSREWLDLIPVVAVERILMAALGASMCFVLQKLHDHAPRMSINFKTPTLKF